MSLDQFPYPVEQLARLPAEVQQALAPHLSRTPDRPVLVIPPFQQFGRQARQPGSGRRFDWLFGSSHPVHAPEWTLALTADRLIAAARHATPATLEVTTIPYDSMIAFEWGAILLYSWIDIVWANPDIRRTRIEYNTVGETHLRPRLESLQRAVNARCRLPATAGQPIDLRPLFQQSMKFYNMLTLHALLSDERVYTCCFEPGRRSRWRWRRGHEGVLWAMTDQHGLLIREPRESHPYGVIYTFCPRGEIRQARLLEVEQNVELHLTVGAAGYEVHAAFPATRATDLMASLEPLLRQGAAVIGPVELDHAQ